MPDTSSLSFNFAQNNLNKFPNTVQSPPNNNNAAVSVVMDNSSLSTPPSQGLSDFAARSSSFASGDGLENILDISFDVNFPTEFPVDKLQTEFYENNNNFVTVRILKIKPLPSSVELTFQEESMKVRFKTQDVKFLSTCEGATEATIFVYATDLAEKIVPVECNFCVKTFIEINLKKQDTKKKWTSLAPTTLIKKNSAEVSSNLQNGNNKSDDLAESFSSVASCSSNNNANIAPSCDENYKFKTSFSEKFPFKLPSPPSSIATKVLSGFTGLRNIGNTCFMNSTLQALLNTVALKVYFCKDYHYVDINMNNPLGMKGELAVAFGDFMKEMWFGLRQVYEPSRIKTLMGVKSSQFLNYGQHDAQEFLSFLLDGLHEDLNRVLEKATTEDIEADGRSDTVIADLSWNAYKSRNDSIIVDLFHGQLKSRLHCPECKRVSITFDPFVYLALPFPKAKMTLSFYFWPSNINEKPKDYTLAFSADYCVEDFLTEFGKIVNIKVKNLRMIEVYNKRFHKTFAMHEHMKTIMQSDMIFVVELFEDLDKAGCYDPVIEFGVIQRKLISPSVDQNVCHYCRKESKEVQFCVGCYKAAYCNRNCQSNDWTKNGHHDVCRNSTPELIGFPFWVSLPKSKLTYKNICSVLTTLSSYSVNFTRLHKSSTKSEDDKSVATKIESEFDEKSMEVDTIYVVADKEDAADNDYEVPSCCTEKEKSSFVPFFLRKCTSEGRNLCHFPHRLTDKGDDNILDISKGDYLAMDWVNKSRSLELFPNEILDSDVVPSDLSKFSKNNELTLTDLLDLYAETEKLSPKEAWYCNKCKRHQEAEKTLLLWRLPPLLVVQFKRFSYLSQMFRNKIETPVDYPMKGLDMSKFLCPGAPKQTTLYDLYAVVCHSGTTYFGHYVSYARLNAFEPNEDDIEWRLFDDSHVCRVSEAEAANSNAYLLFYQRRDDPSKRILDGYQSIARETIDAKIAAFEKLPRAIFAANSNDID